MYIFTYNRNPVTLFRILKISSIILVLEKLISNAKKYLNFKGLKDEKCIFIEYKTS